MKKATINLLTEGIKGTGLKLSPGRSRIILNIDNKLKITVDAYEGQGTTFKNRDVSSIIIETPTHKHLLDTNSLIERLKKYEKSR